MIKQKIKELFKIVGELKEEYPHKEFTLDGRLVGDIGEIIAEQNYQIRLYSKVVPDYDAETTYDKKKVQIKTTMRNSVWYPRDSHSELLLALEIDKEGNHKELYNGETTPFINYLAEKRRRNESYNYYTITKGKLIELNKLVDETSRIKRKFE